MLLTSLLFLNSLAGYALPPSGGPGEPKASPQDSDFRVFYQGGIRFEAADGSFAAKMGGRIQWDSAYVGNNQALESALGTPLEDGTEFRRTRLYISGTVHEEVDFKAQYDFAGGSASFKDVYIAFRNFPVGTLKAGQFKEPFSLEELTSSNSITFLERSLANTFAPSRSTGLQLSDHVDGRFTWAAGVFRDSNSQGKQTADGELNVTGRVTGLVFHEDDGRELLHLGASASLRSPNSDSASWSARPESHLAPTFASTGAMATDSATVMGVEAAWVSGPLSLQGEYVQAKNDLVAGGDATFGGYSVQGSMFLNDSYRVYDPKSGAFKGPKIDGDDALEAKLRFSSLDLTDGPVTGGEMTAITAGLNWYLNDNARLMFEVVSADLDGVDSTLIGQVRCQVTW
jgi:phosphate-selective porin OprO/OprP